MPRCDHCGNEYDKAFEIIMGGERHTFDSFERAIHATHIPKFGSRTVGHYARPDLFALSYHAPAHQQRAVGVSTT